MLKRNLSTDLNTKIMNISPTLNSKLILLDRVNKGLPVYNGGLGENPLPTPNYLIKTLQENNSLLFLNSPNNPTGAVYTKDEYISLIKVFNKYNITVFSDEIYYNTSQIETIYLSELY
jgi:aspartate/methionine/tyrosine aminotransferase